MNATFRLVTIVLIVLGLLLSTFLLFSMFLVSAVGAGLGVLFGVIYAALIIWLLSRTPLWPKMRRAQSVWWVLACLAWGAGFSLVPAYATGGAITQAVYSLGWDEAVASFGGAYPEEPAKALGVVFILMIFRGLNRPWHGFMTGALVGLGFEAYENILYGASLGILHPSSDAAGAVGVLGLRLIAGPFLHIVWTGLVGWGIGQAMFIANRSLGWRFSVAFAWLFIAFAAHFAWNYIGVEAATIVTSIGAAVVMYPLFVWVFVRGWKQSRQDTSYVFTERALTSVGHLPGPAMVPAEEAAAQR